MDIRGESSAQVNSRHKIHNTKGILTLFKKQHEQHFWKAMNEEPIGAHETVLCDERLQGPWRLLTEIGSNWRVLSREVT